MKSDSRDWIRIIGGGCFVNTAVTGILVGLVSSASFFTMDSIFGPFMIGATISFGLSLFLIRSSRSQESVLRRVIYAGLGVLLGSVFAILGVTMLVLQLGN